jgi:flagellar FliL protein
MAEEDEDDVAEDEGEGGGEAPPEKSGKKKLLIIVALLLLLIVGGLAAAYFTGLMDPVIAMITGGSGDGANSNKEQPAGDGQTVFYDLQEMLVNLNTGGRKSSFLKIRISLELENQADIPRIEGVMPRIVDNFQTYLRELRIDDLKGSAGMYRLREELLLRVSAAAAPAKIKDVLFKEMLVQ